MSQGISSKSKNLNRGLTNRHIQLIALGGAIGTGLFMGSGKTISVAGPSITLVYAIIGFFLFFVMRAMGELLLSNLKYKSFMDFSADILGPAAGFYIGWTYWLCWVVTGTADIIGVTEYIHYWFPELSLWVPAFCVVVLMLFLNLVSVHMFGELEFWFSSIKIVAIIGLVFVGIFMVCSGFVSPSGHRSALSNLVDYGGFFPQGLKGFFAGFQIAVFAFVGIELVGTTAAETMDPEKTLPRAINAIPVRIVCFYVFALIAIMAITPWNLLSPEGSPFVHTFNLVGIASAASLVNFIVLTSASSSANSGVYSTSRMLYGLAKIGDAPKIFSTLSQRKVPANGLFFSCFCLLLGSATLLIKPSAIEAFTLITTISATLFIFVWSMILISWIVYARKRPELRAKSKYSLPGGFFSAFACLAFFAFVIILLFLEKETRDALVLTPLWFILLAIGFFVSNKKRVQRTLSNE